MATRKVRYKKLSVKTALPVLREDQIDPNEYESLTTENQIATGVDQAEENEIHLQAALKGHGVSSDNEIPVPPPQESEINYDQLYPTTFQKPSSYIRFSQTVEECIGCQYDMTEDDEVFLRSYNQKRPSGSQLPEDDFEGIMEVFEDTASEKAPFAAIDNTVVAYDMMVPGLKALDSSKIMSHAKEIYEYWKSQRQSAGNKSLHASLKFETHQDSDDMDPYVCFRRREVRQTRKTRARDMQSADKLKRLRRELEEGRQLLLMSREREVMKRELLTADRLVFEQRAKLKESKIRLGIKADDEDLINQRPKRKPEVQVQRPSGTQLRIQVRPDGKPAEQDLVKLTDKLAEKENELREDLRQKMEHHQTWNKNHVDLTRAPLSPVKGPQFDVGFRPAKTEYLMTPPASASSGSPENEPEPMELDVNPLDQVFQFHGMSEDEEATPAKPEYRRRIGRLNRLWIDRRGLASPPPMASDAGSDRWKYDQDSDDEDDPPVYEVDPYDSWALKFRSTIPLNVGYPYARKQIAPGSAGNGHTQPIAVGKPALPQAHQQQQQSQPAQPTAS